MANIVNYATQFSPILQQKFEAEGKTSDLTTNRITISRAKEVKIPYIVTPGYGNYDRANGFKTGNVENQYMTKTLERDRAVSIRIDAMDVDETNEALTAANCTSVFETEHAIPERDAYRLSKIYSECIAQGETASSTVLTTANIFEEFNNATQVMDELGVPDEGRILYVTPALKRMFEQSKEIVRALVVNGASDNTIDQKVNRLNNVKIIQVPPARMKTIYDFTDGFVPTPLSKQINMILIHPKSVIACDKHEFIRIYAPGSYPGYDAWTCERREYGDLFVLNTRADSIYMNVDA